VKRDQPFFAALSMDFKDPVNAAVGELQNHDFAHKAGAGLTNAMQRRDALALASGSTGMRLSFNEHSGDPLPPSVPGGGGGRGRE
jgi:hypothetical protein